MSLLGRLEMVPRHANRDEVRHQRAPDGSGRAADEGTREPEHHQNDRTGHRSTHAAPRGAESPETDERAFVDAYCSHRERRWHQESRGSMPHRAKQQFTRAGGSKSRANPQAIPAVAWLPSSTQTC